MKGRFLILLVALLFSASFGAHASHIVGGEVTYQYLGNNQYMIYVTIYEDCLNGDAHAIAEDNPGLINIFDGNGNPRFDPFDSIQAPQVVPIPTNFTNTCINNPPPTCLHKRVFSKQYYLPPNNSGYIIVYQRCCRNASVLNILNPSQIGATYYCEIPPAQMATGNNSAVFKNYPPQIICINNPLVYDNSATDVDGDSLSYEFCVTYAGGSDNDAKPVPAPPPFPQVVYRSPFSYENPMGGNPRIQIDSLTGLITGTPNLLGRYVVTVCCHEWRNHININTVKREFQFVVTDCSKAVVADIPQFSTDFNTYIVDCQDYTVNFKNQSVGGFSYHWDFGVPGAPQDTSNEFEPTFVYPDTGTYTVSLIVNPGTTCTDSISRLVKVYPRFQTDFVDSGLQCPGSPLTFTDISASTYKPITYWAWDFGDGTYSSAQNPVHAYALGGTYNVTLIAENIKNCVDTVLKQLVIEKFKPSAGNDTVIVKGEHAILNGGGGIQYAWTPATNLNDTTVSNPVGFFPDTGHFAYSVFVTSPFGCKGYDTAVVWVVNQASFLVPNAFTPNGDGKNDIFRPVTVGYGSVNYIRVFNRWGEMVYESHSLESGWDGYFNHQKAEMGTYYWEISLKDRGGKDQKQKGDVILIR